MHLDRAGNAPELDVHGHGRQALDDLRGPGRRQDVIGDHDLAGAGEARVAGASDVDVTA